MMVTTSGKTKGLKVESDVCGQKPNVQNVYVVVVGWFVEPYCS